MPAEQRGCLVLILREISVHNGDTTWEPAILDSMKCVHGSKSSVPRKVSF